MYSAGIDVGSVVTVPRPGFAHDIAVAKVELCQLEVVAGLKQPRVGLLDGGSFGNEPLVNAVEVALRILTVEFLNGLLRSGIPGRGGEAHLCDAPVNRGEGFSHRRKILLEVFGHIERILVIDRQSEAGARLLNRLLGALHAIDRDFQGSLVLIELLAADGPLRHQRFAAGIILLG